MKLMFLGMLLVVLMLPGCSTIESRMKEKQSSFDRLSPKFQDMVRRAQIDLGMNEDAVFIALGAPTKVINRNFKGQLSTAWQYDRLESRSIPNWNYYLAPTRSGQIVSVPYYSPMSVSYWVPETRIYFQNGKVVGWEKVRP